MGLSSSVIVESDEAFQAWLTQAASLPADPIEAGRTVFTRYGCPACHALADAGATGVVGPALDSLADPNGPHAHAHGGMSLGDFVEQSILDPSAAIAPGFADGLMPRDFGTRIPSNELAILVDYLVAQK
jgi:cytochrome c551/c552